MAAVLRTEAGLEISLHNDLFMTANTEPVIPVVPV